MKKRTLRRPFFSSVAAPASVLRRTWRNALRFYALQVALRSVGRKSFSALRHAKSNRHLPHPLALFFALQRYPAAVLV